MNESDALAELPRPAPQRRRKRRHVPLVITLAWLLLLTRFSLVHDPRPRRQPDEPATWKLVVWLVLFTMAIPSVWLCFFFARHT